LENKSSIEIYLMNLMVLVTFFPAFGDGRHLEHILNPQAAPWGQMESSEKTMLTNDKMSWHSEIER